MLKTVKYCDCCGVETSLDEVKVQTGISFDGCEHVADFERVDLCGPCARNLLDVFLPDDKSKEFIEYVRALAQSKKESSS